MASSRNFRKERIGEVISDKMNKSITISIERKVKHAKYQRYIAKTTKVVAHDEKNECGIGDKVLVMETRPLSKRKRWRLVKILQKK